MLTINYQNFTFSGIDDVLIKYDADTDDLLFEYDHNHKRLENYRYDFSRIKDIIARENIEQFFRVRMFKYSEEEWNMMPSDRNSQNVRVEYNGKTKILHNDGVYTKISVVLIAKIEEYVRELRETLYEQRDSQQEED